MKEDIMNYDNSRTPTNRLKPYKDPNTNYIIHPVAKWYEVCIKSGDRWHIERRKNEK